MIETESKNEQARRLYLKYPLLPMADIARLLGVSRQAVDQFCLDLKDERERRRQDALEKIRINEGL
jgi:hypothetical protein